MTLAAQEVAVRYRLMGGSAFRAEAAGIVESIDGVQRAGRRANAAGGPFSFLTRGTKQLDTFHEKLRKTGANMRQAGRDLSYMSLPIIGIGYYAIKAATQFTSATNLLKVQANVTNKELKKITPGMIDIGNATGYTNTQLMQAMYNFESVGLRGSRAVHAMSAAAKGARIGQDSLDNTSRVLSGVLKTRMPDIHSADQAMMLIERTAALGNMKLPELNQAISTGILSQAKAYGLGFKDVAAVLAASSRLATHAPYEANRLKLTLTQLAAVTTGPGIAALHRLNMSPFSLANDMRHGGPVRALIDLSGHLKRFSKNDQTVLISQLFGRSRGVANASVLLNEIDQIAGIRSQLNSADRASFNQRWQTTKVTPAVQQAIAMQRIVNAMTTLGLTLIPIVIPALVKLAGFVNAIATGFSHLPKPLKDVALYLIMAGVVLGPLLWVLGNLVTAFGAVAGLLGLGGSGGLIAGLGGVSEGAGLVGGGLMGLLGPIALAVGAFVLAYETLHPFHSFVNSIFKGGKAAGKQFAGAILGPNYTIPKDVKTPAEFMKWLHHANPELNHSALTRDTAAWSRQFKGGSSENPATHLTPPDHVPASLKNALHVHVHIDGKQVKHTVVNRMRIQENRA